MTQPVVSPAPLPIPIDDLIDDRPQDGIFRLNRGMFSEPALFEQEVARIYEGGWVFLGMSNQAERPHDYFTTQVGRVPVVVMRDSSGNLRCFRNSCSHKGARIAPEAAGSAKLFVCPYHSWTFDSSGACRGIKWGKSGSYTDAFDQQSHDLLRLPAFGEYRGFLFGSLSSDVPSLETYLGEARHMLDLVADQSSEGLELIPGRVRFTFSANWKMQLENCSDQYHFTSTHASLIKVMGRRAQEANASKSTLGSADFWKGGVSDEEVQGSFQFDNGHVLTWGRMDPNPNQALFEQHDRLLKTFGPDRTAWMFYMRNLTLFPNMQIAVNASTQLRVIRPLAYNLTEMETWCLAPKGESASARALRIRQYEDFFNPTGMAIADDNAVYEECQTGMAGQSDGWLQGHARGLASTRPGGNDQSRAIGMEPEWQIAGGPQLSDETLFQSYYREWRKRMLGVVQ